jgi:hypothetical protein
MFKGTYIIHFSILTCLIILIQIFTYRYPWIGVILFILIFTLFDVCGYGIPIHKDKRWNDKKLVIAYRIMQNLFMVSILFLVFMLYGFYSMVGSIVAWWFGTCDVLFYIILGEKITMKFDYKWMRTWSVHLISLLLYKTKLKIFKNLDITNGYQFISAGIIGLVIGIYLQMI